MQEMSPQKQGFEIPMSKNVPYGYSPYQEKKLKNTPLLELLWGKDSFCSFCVVKNKVSVM